MGLTLLAYAKMPLKFWVEAFLTDVHVINLLPSSSVNFQIPFELLYQKPPNYHFLKPFGCACFPFLQPYNKHKFEFHLTKCIFIGYSITQASYKCLHSSSCVYVTRHVQFNVRDFPYSTIFSSSNVTANLPQY